MSEEKKSVFSPLEIDAIGEILNISLGSSATAVSNLLGRRVDITTPEVQILSYSEFEFSSLEPAIGVEITYVEGLSGSNVMLLKRGDVKKILEILMQTEIEDENFELDEIAISAVCEVMNQMMGASATALAEFLGQAVNISTPRSFEIADSEAFKRDYFNPMRPMIVVRFKLSIEACMESEFITLMEAELGKQMIASFGLSSPEPYIPEVPAQVAEEPQVEMAAAPQEEAQMGISEEAASPGAVLTQEQIEKMLQQQVEEPPVSVPVEPQSYQPPIEPQMQPSPQAQPQMQQVTPMEMPQMQPASSAQQQMAPQQMQPQVMQPQMIQMQQPKVVSVQPLPVSNTADIKLTKEESSNLDMIMSVPLQISVEIGKAKRTVREIMEFSSGTLVVLDKLAGDTVDIYVNGQKIAKGDVVVVDDSFGVRITEIIREYSFTGK